MSGFAGSLLSHQESGKGTAHQGIEHMTQRVHLLRVSGTTDLISLECTLGLHGAWWARLWGLCDSYKAWECHMQSIRLLHTHHGRQVRDLTKFSFCLVAVCALMASTTSMEMTPGHHQLCPSHSATGPSACTGVTHGKNQSSACFLPTWSVLLSNRAAACISFCFAWDLCFQSPVFLHCSADVCLYHTTNKE